MKKKPQVKVKKATSNQRIDVAPEGGELAQLGFYASPIQKVIARWRGQLRGDWLQDYFKQIAEAVRFKRNEIDLKVAAPQHWPCVAELFLAVTKLYTDKEKPTYWLLTLPIGVAENGHFEKWQFVRQMIIENGGPTFSPEVLATSAKRLKLSTPPGLARDFLATRPTLTPPYKVRIKLSTITKRRRKL